MKLKELFVVSIFVFIGMCYSCSSKKENEKYYTELNNDLNNIKFMSSLISVDTLNGIISIKSKYDTNIKTELEFYPSGQIAVLSQKYDTSYLGGYYAFLPTKNHISDKGFAKFIGLSKLKYIHEYQKVENKSRVENLYSFNDFNFELNKTSSFCNIDTVFVKGDKLKIKVIYPYSPREENYVGKHMYYLYLSKYEKAFKYSKKYIVDSIFNVNDNFSFQLDDVNKFSNEGFVQIAFLDAFYSDDYLTKNGGNEVYWEDFFFKVKVPAIPRTQAPLLLSDSVNGEDKGKE